MKKILVNYTMVVALLMLALTGGYGQSYTVMTYNIRYDNPADSLDNWHHRKQDMVEFIESTDALIFGIQEGLESQVTYLDQELANYQYLGVGRDDGKHQGEYCAVFYQPEQVRLLTSGTFWLSESHESISVGWDAALPRICTYGLFEDENANKFWVFNTHFDHKGAVARERSATLITQQIAIINENDLPVILMGDFNATSEQAPIKVLSNYFQSSNKPAVPMAEGPTGTFNGFQQIEPDRRIDYIFSKGVDLLSYKHADPRRGQGRFLSDHLPVIAVIAF